MDFSRFHWLTFDCYGTLIDWESGILGVLRPLLAAHRRNLSDAGILELYSALESEIEAGEYCSYREVLQTVVQRMGARLVFTPTVEQAVALPESVPQWKPFPDTVEALRRLKQRYKLAIISNVDDDLFAGTARQLEVPFDAVITAQQAGSYKPSLSNFHLALRQTGAPREQVLHCAESLYHDIAPANELGISSVWVNRAGERRERASRLADAKPDLTVPDLRTLADLALA